MLRSFCAASGTHYRPPAIDYAKLSTVDVSPSTSEAVVILCFIER